MATILSIGCSDVEPPDGTVEVYVDSTQCSLPSTCNKRFGLFVLRGGCVYAWATKTGDGGQLDLSPFDLEKATIQVLATCGTESCVRCWGSGSFEQERRIELALKPVASCTIAQAVTTPCTECGPTEGAYCDGNRRVTCVEGQTRIETCPEGCSAGACGACTKITYYKDIDGDTYGDAQATVEACMPPPNYVVSSTDCDDADRDAYPTQTGFFTEPTLSKKNYDYDCNGIEEQERTQSERNCIYVFSNNTCTGGGWRGSVPACGQTGTDVTCTRVLGIFCISTPGPGTQACR